MKNLKCACVCLAISTCAFAQGPRAEHSPEDLVEPSRLMADLRALPTARSAWADERHKQGLRNTERFVVDRLRALGYEPELDPVDAIGARASRPAETPAGGDGPSREDLALGAAPWNNIIVNLPGSGDAKDVIIFAAHIDAVADAPGADDNGTGVVALLEAARVLHGRSMQRTLRLIFFNLEEVGLVGSRIYADRLKPRLQSGEERVLGMASIDGIGYFTDEPGSQTSPKLPIPGFSPPTVGDFLAIGGISRHRVWSRALSEAMQAAEPRLKLFVVDMLPIAPPDLLRSDHAPFLGVGVAAVIITDTANFRSPHYHKPTDTPDTIDAERFTHAVRGLVGAMHRLAGPEGAPLIELRPKPASVPASR